jgi:hypothetical protein
MKPTNFRVLPFTTKAGHGQKIFMGGTKELPLGDPETAEWLKERGVKEVFCLYPITNKQFTGLMTEAKRGTTSLADFHRIWHIDPKFLEELSKQGIRVSSLVRNPESFRNYESFAREASQVRGNIAVQCFAGKHASSAYVLYYLARNTNMTYHEVQRLFIGSGLTPKDLTLISSFLKSTGIDIHKMFEAKERAMEQARKRKKKQKNHHKEKNSSIRPKNHQRKRRM